MLPKRERNAEMVRLHSEGWGYARLAERYDIDISRVGQIIRAERCKIPLRDRLEIVQDMAAQLDALRARAEEIVYADSPIAMSQGKPVPLRNSDGSAIEGRYAADHGMSLAAMDAIVRIQHRESRLLGTDQPTQARVEGSMTIEMRGIEDV